MFRTEFLSELLSRPTSSIPRAAYDALRGALPGQEILYTTSILAWHLAEYARAGLCRLEPLAGVDNLSDAQIAVEPRSILPQLMTGGLTIEWELGRLHALHLRWDSDCGGEQGLFLWGAERAVLEEFAYRCAAYTHDVHGEILIFSDGYWQKSETLFRAVQGVGFDDVVLPAALKREIEGDLTHFLGARAEYERLAVPWKRGILFVGPPGNGKTHCIKAIINHFGLPCLYVQSFEARGVSSEHNIGLVFERARRTTPCFLVLEDLDALITNRNRSFFLNQLDGFHRNVGVIALASTNHPERLDPSIVDRPSRFDRKYHFWLPGADERRRYLASWNRRLHAEMRMSEDELDELTVATDEFSYAYLKELMLSSITSWIATDKRASIAPLASAAQATLRQQMHSEVARHAARPVEQDDDDEAHADGGPCCD